MAHEMLVTEGTSVEMPDATNSRPVSESATPSFFTAAEGKTQLEKERIFVRDDWIMCDECDQWRLLMPRVNVNTLPKRWLCKMMDWLPGMNDCKFTEEETTKALYILRILGCQLPVVPDITAMNISSDHS